MFYCSCSQGESIHLEQSQGKPGGGRESFACSFTEHLSFSVQGLKSSLS